MALEFNVSDDFSTILDGFEEIAIKRRDSADTIVVPRAWRFSSQTEEAAAGISDVARHDVVWQFGWDESLDEPRIGDSVIDGSNQCWTILTVSGLRGHTRLRCLTRNLYLVHGLIDRVDVQQAIWDNSGSEPQIVGWSVLRTAVPARIQPERVAVDAAGTPPTSTATYRVVLGEQIPLDHNHRIVGPDGAVYQLIDYAQAERIDALPIATVRKLANS